VPPGSPTDAQIQRQLERILAHKTFARSKRLSTLLRTIVEETLQGEPGALKESVLAVTLYGQENYDPRENSRVRVDATTLRSRLKEYYFADGGNDDILIEVPKGAYVASFQLRTPIQQRRARRMRIAPIASIGCAAGLIVALGLWRRVETRSGFEPPVQLTFDEGFTGEPSMSADGDTLAYASDRGKDGIVHIWVQSGSAPPRQITSGSSHDFRPELSPDGRTIAFRSLRDIDGLFTIRTSGGAPTRLVNGGFSHHFSPDGRLIAYSGSTPDSIAHVFVIDSAGHGVPRRIDFGVSEGRCPVWTPDGRNLVFLGHSQSDWDYWIASLDAKGVVSRPLGVQALLRRAKLPELATSFDCPQDWNGDRLLFLVTGGEPVSVISTAMGPGNVFQIRLSPSDWTPTGAVEALEPALRTENLRVAKDRHWMVFSAHRNIRSVWSLIVPVAKPPVFFRAVEDPGIRGGSEGTLPGLSADGNVICFALERAAKPDILCKDLTSRTEKLLGVETAKDSLVVPDTHGRRVAFVRSSGEGNADLVVREIATGAERVISSDCPVLQQWAADQSFFLCLQSFDRPAQLYRIAFATGERTRIMSFRSAPLHMEASPDGLWLAFVVNSGENALQGGYVVSLKENPEDPSRWIKVTQERFDLSLHWSPDGSSIYFWQLRDGSRCLWGQRLDPNSKRPVGLPFAVLHRHTYQAYPLNGGTLAVAGSGERLSFAMTLSDSLSNVWRASFGK